MVWSVSHVSLPPWTSFSHGDDKSTSRQGRPLKHIACPESMVGKAHLAHLEAMARIRMIILLQGKWRSGVWEGVPGRDRLFPSELPA